MKRFFILFLTALSLAGCNNVFVNHILGDPDGRSANKNKPIYTVTIDPLENGRIAARPSSGHAGTEIILMVSPNPGYRLQKDSLKYIWDKGEAAIDEATRTFSLPAQNVRVSAVFEPLPADNFSVSVKIEDLEHGVIIAQPEYGFQGDPVYLTVIPDPGYRYKSGTLKYNDTPVDELTRTFSLPGKHVLVTAEFEALPRSEYTVRIGVLQNGRIFAKPEFSPPGAEIYLHVSPDPVYILKENSLRYTDSMGETIIHERGRTFTMPADHVMVAAEFEPVPPPDYYTVSVRNVLNGRVLPVPGYGKEKTPVYLHVIPDPGYILKENSLKIKGPSVEQQVNETSRIFEMPAEHVTAAAEFKALPPGEYTVRVDMIDHGRIFAAPAYGKEGTEIALKIHPDFGYRLKTDTLRYITQSGLSAPVDEVARTFPMPADHVTVRAEFEQLPSENYMVFPAITLNGHVSPAPESGPKDTEIFLWVTPDPGYKYKAGTLNFKVDETVQGTPVPDTTRTFRLPESHVLAGAEFEPVESGKYTIRVKPAVHGRIYVNPETAAAGEIITLTIVPNPKYGLKKDSLKYSDADGAAAAISETFIMPGKHITIHAEFESVEHRVRINKKLSGGQITVKPEKAYPGAVISLRVTPANGNKYEAGSLQYLDSRGGIKTIDEKTLRFIMPNEEITLTAEFKPFTAMLDLEVNDKSLVKLADGKTNYTFWIPSGDTDAVFTFDTAANAKAEPESGTKHTLRLFDNAPVKYTVKDPDGITTTTYTFVMVKELVPTEQVPFGNFIITEGKNSLTMDISAPFRIGKYELTQEEWRRVMGYDRGTQGDKFPAHGMTWYEALEFCNRLSMLEKKTPVYVINGQTDPDLWEGAVKELKANWGANGYRLPTEMEWLWAAMGANNGKTGTNPLGARYAYAGASYVPTMGEAAWFANNSGKKHHERGTKSPNILGLHDMSGNVGEWCWDWYDGGRNYERFTAGAQDYTGPASGTLRIVRGGYYNSNDWNIFLSFRGDAKINANRHPARGAQETGMRIFCRD
jgi:formylglycine-generating enzyme required for sulfatase activity